MARVRLFTVAGPVREEARPGTIPLTRCQRGLRAPRGDLDLHMILATYEVEARGLPRFRQQVRATSFRAGAATIFLFALTGFLGDAVSVWV